MSLPTLHDSVQKLQMALQAKAKAEPSYRFYSLWDKVCRRDVLWNAYRHCRANDGAPGVDRITFDQIEARGVEPWLAKLQEELRNKTYCPLPLLRVWIDKSNGGQRPLGIPAIRDRVAQMAVLLVIGPIFEADLCREQYGFRPGKSAKMAIQKAYYHVTERGLSEVVDADLSDYLDPASYYTPVNEDWVKRVDCASNTFIRKPLRLPQRMWTASSWPSFTRCNTVCRETPRMRVASIIGTKPAGAVSTKRDRSSLLT